MARTLPAAFSSAIAATFQKPVILHKIGDLDNPIYITSSDDGLVFDSETYRGWQAIINGELGIELDWRGGLGVERPYSLEIIQASDTLDGTSDVNTLDIFKQLFISNRKTMVSPVVANAVNSSFLSSDGAGDLKVYLVFDDSTPVIAESIQLFGGAVRDMSFSDAGYIRLEFGGFRDGYIDRKIVTALGDEQSGDENYDTAIPRTISEAGIGKAVPITYGEHPFAYGLFVHDEPTRDMTERSGLIVCFSDARFRTRPYSSLDIELFVWDSNYKTKIFLPKSVMDDTTDDRWNEMFTTAVFQESVKTTNRGLFVAWLKNGNPFSPSGIPNDFPGDSSRGDLVLEYPETIFRNEHAYSGLTNPWVNGPKGVDGITTTFAPVLGSGGLKGTYKIFTGYNWQFPDIDIQGKIRYLCFKFKAIKNNAHAWEISYTQVDQIETAKVGAINGHYGDLDLRIGYNPSSFPTSTATTYDSWTGADDPLYFRSFDFRQQTGNGDAHYTLTPKDLSGGVISIGIDTIDAAATMDVYGSTYQLFVARSWIEFQNKIFAEVDGIIDEAAKVYSDTNHKLLETPSDIFHHFMAEVVGEPTRVNTASVATARTAMQADGIKFAFQLKDLNIKAGDVLDKMALQSMSWIFPDEEGKEKIIYRPSLALSVENAENPIDRSDILKGSMRVGLTSREDLYAGVIINYSWNEAAGRYENQRRITPTGFTPKTKVGDISLGAECQLLCDSVPDFSKQILEVDADYVQDGGTADKLLRWLVQQYTCRRQTLEFDLSLEHAALQIGDLIAVNHPAVRAYSYSNAMTIVHTTGLCTVGGVSPFPGYIAEHVNDVLFIEGSGANGGKSFRISDIEPTPFFIDGAHTIVDQVGVPEPFRVCPAFAILKAAPVLDKDRGLVIRVKCVEAPVIRAGKESI